MTTVTLEREPACPEPALEAGNADQTTLTTPSRWRVEERAFDTIPRSTWDALVARNPWATPFSEWAFHRAWWDAYGANAHEQTLVVVPSDAPTDGRATPVAIVPLMHRHEVEPSDALTRTTMRHGTDTELTPVAPDATAIFLGASYHADYATILAAPTDVPEVSAAIAAYLASPAAGDWDAVDLRRLRCGDPFAEELAAALGALEIANGWTLNLEREDVCPVVTLPDGLDMDGFLSSLGKKERHEIRRKVRRAAAAGEIRLVDSVDPLADLDAFIDLHQKRWGDAGLFPPTVGGDQSRTLFRRMFELWGTAGPIRLAFLTVGGRRIATGIHFETSDGYLYFNAGVDPDARDLSPGVVMIHAYIERALADGRHRLDFLRGNEPYKYQWGAVDEPIQRVLLRRRTR